MKANTGTCKLISNQPQMEKEKLTVAIQATKYTSQNFRIVYPHPVSHTHASHLSIWINDFIAEYSDVPYPTGIKHH